MTVLWSSKHVKRRGPEHVRVVDSEFSSRDRWPVDMASTNHNHVHINIILPFPWKKHPLYPARDPEHTRTRCSPIFLENSGFGAVQSAVGAHVGCSTVGQRGGERGWGLGHAACAVYPPLWRKCVCVMYDVRPPSGVAVWAASLWSWWRRLWWRCWRLWLTTTTWTWPAWVARCIYKHVYCVVYIKMHSSTYIHCVCMYRKHWCTLPSVSNNNTKYNYCFEYQW